MEPLVDARVHTWMSKLDDAFAGTGKQFDFAPWAVYVYYLLSFASHHNVRLTLLT